MQTNDSRQHLGKILRQQRQTSNLTLYDLSTASGVSPSHLGRIEKGDRYPSASVLQRIAKPLGFTEGQIFTLAGYLTSEFSTKYDESPKGEAGLDPYVARLLAQEPVEVQKSVIGILTIMKNIASGLDLYGNPGAKKSSV
ncbi:MAG: helix-turn-helix domain-containing protein [Dehalococcoidales bacterium]|nr:helix-turn-helix domain-containing protein [Dehalococcoidales bacterium]